MAWVVLAVLVAGCHEDPLACVLCGTDDARPDLIWTAPAVDAGAPPDLAGIDFCEGTPVAGTCAQGFFYLVSRCYVAAGACTLMSDSRNYANLCWDNGSRILVSYLNGKDGAHGLWKNGAETCLEGYAFGLNSEPVFTLHRGGDTLAYDEKTGDVTCPDGTHANIGPREGDCGMVRAILSPGGGQCAKGNCE